MGLDAAGVGFHSLLCEALAEAPEAHSRALLAHLGLPWHPDGLSSEENPRTVMTLSP